MSTPLLQVDNLESYYGPVLAIRGVSLSVESGQIVSVLGANGAGKTTLLKTLSGVMNPEKGSVSLNGDTLTGLPPEQVVARGVIHVPEGREIFPLLSVADNLAMGAFLRRDRDAIARDHEMVLDYFPVLRERLAQAAGTLSGGQQQMLAIGRGLMANPRIMLLDEPSLGLSPRLVGEIFDIIKRLNTEQGVTLMLVEQNARVALSIAHHAYVMELGRVVMSDSAEKMRQSRDIQQFYLGEQEDGVRGQRRWKARKTWR